MRGNNDVLKTKLIKAKEQIIVLEDDYLFKETVII